MPSRVRPMTPADMDVSMRWAAAEGWNPGAGDGRYFLPVDPDGFLVAEDAGRVVGTIGMPRFGPAYAFAGLFIVHPAYRGGATGARLVRAALRHSGTRMVGTDGVLEREESYARLGFARAHLHQRHSGTPRGGAHPAVVPLSPGLRDALVDLDDACFPGDRRAFMARWIATPHVTMASVDGAGAPDGLAVARQAIDGWRVGPLIAPDADRAQALVRAIAAQMPGQVLHLDVNTGNPEAPAMARDLGMSPGFACVRMYRGGIPDLPLARMFGSATLELG